MRLLPVRLSFYFIGFLLVLITGNPACASDTPSPALPRVFASSHQAFAQGLYDAGPESIRETRTVLYFNDDLSDLVLGYANYVTGATGNWNFGQGNVNVKFALEYEGKFYPFLIKGQRMALCADATALKTDPLSVAIKGGTYGAIRMWEQKLDPKPDKNQWLWSSSGDPAFNEGAVYHSDPNRDWSLGGAPGETAEVKWTISDSGVVIPTIENAGTDIKASGVIVAILDSQRKGSGFGYVATTTAGSLGSWYQSEGGSGYSQDTWVGPTNMGGYGAGGATFNFGPSVIAGTPTKPTKSILLLSDSIGAGFGASDKRGDIWRNFGIFSRAVSKKANICNAAIPGLTAFACDSGYGRTRDLIKSILNPQIVWINLGTNDIQQSIDDWKTKTPQEALQGHLASMANWWSINCGSEIWFGTILPRVTLDKDPTTQAVNQTPLPGFETGGIADQVNAAILNKTIFPQAGRIVDTRALVENPSDKTKWRIDHGVLTDDGTHPTDSNGIPWIANNLNIAIP